MAQRDVARQTEKRDRQSPTSRPFFIVVFLIEEALRNRYDLLQDAVSAPAIGPRGWVQQANFIVTGALMFAYAFGLSSALRAYGGSFWAPVLVGIYALGLIGAGIFVTDRPGLRDRSAERRKRHVRGILHDVCSLFAFIHSSRSSYSISYSPQRAHTVGRRIPEHRPSCSASASFSLSAASLVGACLHRSVDCSSE